MCGVILFCFILYFLIYISRILSEMNKTHHLKDNKCTNPGDFEWLSIFVFIITFFLFWIWGLHTVCLMEHPCCFPDTVFKYCIPNIGKNCECRWVTTELNIRELDFKGFRTLISLKTETMIKWQISWHKKLET